MYKYKCKKTNVYTCGNQTRVIKYMTISTHVRKISCPRQIGVAGVCWEAYLHNTMNSRVPLYHSPVVTTPVEPKVTPPPPPTHIKFLPMFNCP